MDLQKKITGVLKAAEYRLNTPALESLKKIIYRTYERLDSPMQVAVIGKISSSKSTLVNAILGQDEVVATGHKEVTFNVSWLKYGSKNDDIIVHYKNNKSPEPFSREKWLKWANHENTDKIKDAISYMEVPYESSMLKRINLIDTPGLEAFYSIDSQNTKDFLTTVKKPDAVIVLFANGVGNSILDVVKDFQGSFSDSFTPINAIGVLSKIDDYWPSEDNALDAGRRVMNRLVENDPTIKKTLFNVLPLISQLALASSTIEEKDIFLLNQLATQRKETIYSNLKTASRFISATSELDLPVKDRDYLQTKFGRYGIWILTNYIRDNNAVLKAELMEFLKRESGFDVFLDTLENHFNKRALLIKLNSAIAELKIFLNIKTSELNAEGKSIIDSINREIDSILNAEPDFKEFEVLQYFYRGKLEFTEEQANDLLHITGEFGHSAMSKLNFEGKPAIKDMVAFAYKKRAEWNEYKSTYGFLDPVFAEAAEVISNSYLILKNKIIDAENQVNEISNFLYSD
jgi:hypothetical protein